MKDQSNKGVREGDNDRPEGPEPLSSAATPAKHSLVRPLWMVEASGQMSILQVQRSIELVRHGVLLTTLGARASWTNVPFLGAREPRTVAHC